MARNEGSNSKELRTKNYEGEKMNTSEKSKQKKEKSLPWWVEFLFVQVGLPDNLLIKILKTKRNSKEFIKNEKKLLMLFLFIIISLVYSYPVIRHAKNKLNCERNAKQYFIKNKKITQINKRELKMLSTNFCYGGNEINLIRDFKN